MGDSTPDHAEEEFADLIDGAVPTRGSGTPPLVGLGGSAGAIPALQTLMRAFPADCGLALVVVMNLSPEHESTLPELLQRCTTMPVVHAPAVDLRGDLVEVAIRVSPAADIASDLLLVLLEATPAGLAAEAAPDAAPRPGPDPVARHLDREIERQAAEALRSSEARLRLIVESATDYAIFSTDLERRVTSWNSGAERLLGYRESEVMGRNADIIFTPEDRAAGAPDHESHTAVAVGRAPDDRFHLRKDGSVFWASGAMMLMRDATGEAVGLVKILRDQTVGRESQQALERSQVELVQALQDTEKARAALQEADEAKNRFLAVLSHELRNPLASIDIAASLLLTDGVDGPDREAAARVVRRQAQAMGSLMSDLLDMSRLTFGRLELHRQPVLLAPLVDAVLETTRPLLDRAGHTLKVDLPACPVQLDADALRLNQVLSNLLANAIKYTPRGGLIQVMVKLEGDQVVISVADNGVGMRPQDLDRVFEMFAQADHVPSPGNAGLGIGLALVRSIVELHGGTVQASSAGPGKGSELRVRLPAARAAPQADDAGVAPPAPPARDARQRGLILIADDNVDVGWGMAKLLEISGFATVRVAGGFEAVSECARQQPDVAILDIGMPDLNGHEAARQIRATSWGRQMVLIAATGWGQESDKRMALEAGFDAHMTKPVDLRKLGAMVDALLAQRVR